MENRKYIRLPTGAEIEFKELNFPLSKTENETSQAKEVSGGGILFVTDQQLVLNTLIEIKIHLLGWRKKDIRFSIPITKNWLTPLIVVCKVIRVKEKNGLNEIAAEFINIDEDDRHALLKFIEEEDNK